MDIALTGTAGLVLYAAFFLAGMMDAVIGGGGLITMPSFLAVGFPARYISGTTICAGCPGSFISFGKFAASGQVDWRSALPAVPTAIIGSLLGARLNVCISEDVLEKIMVVLIPVVAVIMIFNKDLGEEDLSGTFSKRRLYFQSAIIGLAVGTYHGFYSVGAGMFYILAFALINKMKLTLASGNAKLVVISANISGTLTYAFSDAVVWKLALPAMAFNIAGNYLGARLALSKGAKIIRPMFYVVIALLMATVLIRLLT